MFHGMKPRKKGGKGNSMSVGASIQNRTGNDKDSLDDLPKKADSNNNARPSARRNRNRTASPNSNNSGDYRILTRSQKSEDANGQCACRLWFLCSSNTLTSLLCTLIRKKCQEHRSKSRHDSQ
jgi:hypothetical protein